ncbi:ATP-dependent DNA helicase [Nesterenkonia sp. CL21]|uniref:ATP-dependent helicase n=1 Tax=Nesterenkonia sp. CL21 TaxID=3064894 RepID=UPI0028796DDD|nr:ATP-dependent DNA helicase [Nesterenkonia sp. CL21]MDS2171161.1 ATP-dependent DNA helicase [Nesterenkonia sp. CL21]
MEFDASQGQVLAAVAEPGHGPVLVHGGPGSGKSTLTAELALRHLEAGLDSHRLLVLSPTRASSAALRDEIETSWARRDSTGRGGSLSEQPSRSFASYAFWLLGEARRREILSFRARQPRLLSGAEQDSIIRELLAPDPTTGLAAVHWPSALREAAGTDGFRKEIRELFDRAAEYGVSPGQLRALADACGRPEWRAAADLYESYREDLDAGSNADAFDPAGLINEACNLLEENPEFLDDERLRLQRVVVDDVHEATPSVFRLLRLIGAGQDVIAFATPETAVQGFRGARPDKLRSWTIAPQRLTAESAERSGMTLNPETDLEIDGVVRRSVSGAMTPDPHGGLPGAAPSVMVLRGNHRIAPEVGRAYARAVRRLAPIGPQEPRQPWLKLLGDGADTAPHAAPGSCAVEIVPQDYLAEQFVLQEVLDRHHRTGVPFDEIAVIARNGAMLQRLVRMFQAQGVPVRQSMSDVVLNQEPAVHPLLRILDVVADPEAQPVELPEALTLLTSRYGEADSMTLRSLRQVLRQQERRSAVGEPRSSDELLCAAINTPEDPVVAAVQAQERYRHLTRGAVRIAAMIQSGRAAFGASVGPEELLWAIWDAAGVSAHWAGVSRKPTAEGRVADQDLDAVMALFQAAERFADQNPGATPQAFVDHMERLELPMDTLAKTSAGDQAVEVLTPASAAGREFDTVILTGLQEGAWPNLNPRGQLLGGGQLVDVVEGRTDTSAQSPLVKRMSVLQDEYRLFASAVSRAKRRLFAVAVHGQEESPSMLLDLVVPPNERTARGSAIPRPITAPRLIAELRRHLEHSFQRELDGATASPADEQEREAAARALARLAHDGLTGAHPDQWWGLPELSTEDPLLGPEDVVRVSPSSVQTAVESPLQWFTSAAGGVEATDFSRMLGSLIHEIAEHHPTETEVDVLLKELEQRWHSLGRDEGWEAERDRRRAETMIGKLAQYFRAAQQEGREVEARELQVEATLEVPVPEAQHTDEDGAVTPEARPDPTRTVQIRGVIDRVERTADGKLFVIDLKTGRGKPTKDDIVTHAQLGAYQLLVSLGAVDQALTSAAGEDQGSGTARPERPSGSLGAALLHVGTGVRKIDLQGQTALGEGDSWPLEQVTLAAQVMSGARYDAFHASQGRGCRIGALCPLCTDAKQVTQP